MPFVVDSEAIVRPPLARLRQRPVGFPMKKKQLLNTPIRVVNLGLESFARDLKERGVPVVHVAWRPPAVADSKMAKLLSKLGH